MKRTSFLPLATLAATIFASSYAQAANTVYNAGGPLNDWTDADNWTAGVPDDGDNALFTGPGMVLSADITQSVGSLYVGYNTTNTFEITTGGVLTNTHQTLVGFGTPTNSIGTLNVIGGTLNTARIRLGLSTTALGTSSVSISSGIINIDKRNTAADGEPVTLEHGTFDLGAGHTSAFTMSGGTVTTEGDFNLIRGSLNIVGNGGSLIADEAFNFGTHSTRSVTASFSTNAAGAVSTIFADSFSYLGTNTLSIDGTAGTVAGTLTLFSLTTDTFSGSELSTLQSALSLNNISGTLSLANANKDLVFTAIPEPGTYALLGGLFALSFVALRRR